MKKKRILFFINSGLKNAGVPRIAVDIIEGLSDEFQFDLAVQCDCRCYFDASLIDKGCKIYYLGNPKMGRKGMLYNLFTRNLQIFKILKNGKYDIVHSFTAYQSGFDCVMAAFAGVKTKVSNAHGVVKRTKRGVTNLYEQLCIYLIRRYATHRIGVSQQVAELIYSSMSYQVIYNSVDFNKYRNISRQEHEGINLLQIGYFNDNKNQLFSLALLKHLLDKGKNVHLYFIGYENTEGYKKKMDYFIENNQLLDNVTFLPHDYKKECIFPCIDFVLQPSHHEGFSLVALESQAANLRCLVSCAIPEDVDMGLLSRLDIDDIEIWSDHIIGKPNIPMGYDGAKAEKFSREIFFQKFKTIYGN